MKELNKREEEMEIMEYRSFLLYFFIREEVFWSFKTPRTRKTVLNSPSTMDRNFVGSRSFEVEDDLFVTKELYTQSQEEHICQSCGLIRDQKVIINIRTDTHDDLGTQHPNPLLFDTTPNPRFHPFQWIVYYKRDPNYVITKR